jgi:hypothetical protein
MAGGTFKATSTKPVVWSDTFAADDLSALVKTTAIMLIAMLHLWVTSIDNSPSRLPSNLGTTADLPVDLTLQITQQMSNQVGLTALQSLQHSAKQFSKNADELSKSASGQGTRSGGGQAAEASVREPSRRDADAPFSPSLHSVVATQTFPVAEINLSAPVSKGTNTSQPPAESPAEMLQSAAVGTMEEDARLLIDTSAAVTDATRARAAYKTAGFLASAASV